MAVMSDATTALEDEEQTAPDKTFLQVFKESLRQARKLVPVHQLTIVAKLSPSAQDIGVNCENTIEEIKNKIWEKKTAPSGLLLIYPQLCLHVIEGTSFVITEVIKSAASEISENGMFQQVRILNISHDIQRKLYYHWSYHEIKGGALRQSSSTDSSVEKQVLEVLSQMLHLGVYISDISLDQMQNVMESIMEGASDMIPPEGKLKSLVDEPTLWSVEEYITRHLSPKNLVSEEERVWPAPDKLIISMPSQPLEK